VRAPPGGWGPCRRAAPGGDHETAVHHAGAGPPDRRVKERPPPCRTPRRRGRLRERERPSTQTPARAAGTAAAAGSPRGPARSGQTRRPSARSPPQTPARRAHSAPPSPAPRPWRRRLPTPPPGVLRERSDPVPNVPDAVLSTDCSSAPVRAASDASRPSSACAGPIGLSMSSISRATKSEASRSDMGAMCSESPTTLDMSASSLSPPAPSDRRFGGSAARSTLASSSRPASPSSGSWGPLADASDISIASLSDGDKSSTEIPLVSASTSVATASTASLVRCANMSADDRAPAADGWAVESPCGGLLANREPNRPASAGSSSANRAATSARRRTIGVKPASILHVLSGESESGRAAVRESTRLQREQRGEAVLCVRVWAHGGGGSCLARRSDGCAAAGPLFGAARVSECLARGLAGCGVWLRCQERDRGLFIGATAPACAVARGGINCTPSIRLHRQNRGSGVSRAGSEPAPSLTACMSEGRAPMSASLPNRD
jgi:hypothetical protein